ncbi:hypothetical protein QFC22_004830 [Naganishia vaughanmartiniae]|uniref:Uncharacterized protein n=1 Tax=Naganishia vaughanmartiniae TaxID=1424756 RepID=A0ACC2WYZ5_9TREE|nr:hypothetical protein QFC22_004830 [Naganishia vaughanmartiniae]
MTSERPTHIKLPPQPTPSDVFSRQHNSALDTAPTPSDADSPATSPYRHSSTRGDTSNSKGKRSTLGRASGGPADRPSFSSAYRSTSGNYRARRMSKASTLAREALMSAGNDEGKPAIPSLLPNIRPAYSTPLPVLPMVVLCIAMMSEFVAANVSTPFLLQMVEDFFRDGSDSPPSDMEAKVGLWTGNLVSVFFVTQFLTSVLWSQVADKYGRRAVLFSSLLGGAVFLMLFGMSKSLAVAILIRLAQGVFGGAVGVYRGSIRDITDSTNETRAYAILGFSWGFGGVAGPVIGGGFESPARNYPNSFFAKIRIFEQFPYLLPCTIAAAFLAVGALLATGLSWDGGPKRKPIALPMNKDEGLQPTAELARETGGTDHNHLAVSTVLAERSRSRSGSRPRGLSIHDAEAQEVARHANRMSMGGAHGYGAIRRKRESMAARASRRESMATVRINDDGKVEDFNEEEEPVSLARRLLLANEENTFNINDLWVSAAIAADISVFDDEENDEEDGDVTEDTDADQSASQSRLNTPSRPSRTGDSPYRNEDSTMLGVLDTLGESSSKSRLAGRVSFGAGTASRNQTLPRVSGAFSSRRFSTTSGAMPAIFANTGLQTPPAIAAAYDVDPLSQPTSPTIYRDRSPLAGLSAIDENTVKDDLPSVLEAIDSAGAEKGWQALPKLIILQYALLALHDTVHGQVFLSFLVSPYATGGIGLLPSSFSILIALMCLFQIWYQASSRERKVREAYQTDLTALTQFFLYPNIGPPRGRFSHLSMFRLGSFLYIPAYLTLPLIRAFATPDKHGGPLVMTLSPPGVVSLANGLAQSLVSLGRFLGPVLGGILWSRSIDGNPGGYAHGFYM